MSDNIWRVTALRARRKHKADNQLRKHAKLCRYPESGKCPNWVRSGVFQDKIPEGGFKKLVGIFDKEAV
jgi:hypothetical protein